MELNEALSKYWRDLRPDSDNLPLTGKPRNKGEAGRPILAKVMADLGFRKGAEVGVLRGRSAVMWLNAIPELHLTAIDPWTAYSERTSGSKQQRAYEQAMGRLKGRNVRIIRAPSLEAVDEFEDGAFDFVHIDGCHAFDAVCQDIIRYTPKVREGGLVLVHDYFEFFRGGIVAAVKAYVEAHKIDPWYVTYDVVPTAFWQKGAERL